jgi:hypothetical protein
LGRVASRPEPLTLTVQPKEQAHGEESKEGRESEGRHQGCSEEGQGARTVTLTRFQIHERQMSLPSAFKAALREPLTGSAIARQEGWGTGK